MVLFYRMPSYIPCNCLPFKAVFFCELSFSPFYHTGNSISVGYFYCKVLFFGQGHFMGKLSHSLHLVGDTWTTKPAGSVYVMDLRLDKNVNSSTILCQFIWVTFYPSHVCTVCTCPVWTHFFEQENWCFFTKNWQMPELDEETGCCGYQRYQSNIIVGK